MAGRPPTPIGSHGEIRVREYAWNDAGEPTAYRAITYFRDEDGESRRVSRTGKTAAGAKRELQKALTARDVPTSAGGITRDTRLRDFAPVWLDSIQHRVDAGKRSPGTVRAYRLAVNRHILPLMGGLRLAEARDVTRCDVCLRSIAENIGAPTAQIARAALSGMLGYAIRVGVIEGPNPVRECSPIESTPSRKPRAMTESERAEWLGKLEADRQARERDMPDLTRMLLATGARISEMLAVDFEDIDLQAGTLALDWQITRVAGKGLVRRRVKSKAGERTLNLPSWAVSVVRRRKLRFGSGPLFPNANVRRHPGRDVAQPWRDPSNTSRDFRETRDKAGFGWVTSHVFRQTVATVLDDADVPARVTSNQLGHSRTSMTTDKYLSRHAVGEQAAAALEGINPDVERGESG